MDESNEGDAAATPGSDAEVADTYRRLRSIAHRQLRRCRPGETLNTTALVHEVWIRLAAGDHHGSLSRDEFLKLASTAMRRLIVDYVRRRSATKRGGGACVLSLDEDVSAGTDVPVIDVIALDAALDRLGTHDPSLEQLVECRFFAGLTMQETASVMARPMRSVERDWARARAYLLEALEHP